MLHVVELMNGCGWVNIVEHEWVEIQVAKV